MFKMLEQRLMDYVESHPAYDVNTFYDVVLQNHKVAIFKMQHRIRDRIQHMLNTNENVFFITMTFDDNHLPKSNDDKIKSIDDVIQFMKSNNVSAFVANVDYGKDNGRFHWHAVAQSVYDFSHIHWTQGAVNFKRVPKTQIPLKLSRYLVKLQRHAVKITDPVMIYYPYRYKK